MRSTLLIPLLFLAGAGAPFAATALMHLGAPGLGLELRMVAATFPVLPYAVLGTVLGVALPSIVAGLALLRPGALAAIRTWGPPQLPPPAPWWPGANVVICSAIFLLTPLYLALPDPTASWQVGAALSSWALQLGLVLAHTRSLTAAWRAQWSEMPPD